MVIAFRRWLDRWGGPDWAHLLGGGQDRPADAAAGEMPLPRGEALLDRYHQHTRLCSSCRGALRTIRRLQGLGVALAVVAVALAALLPDGLRWSRGVPLLLSALAGLTGAAALRWGLEPRFRYRPYDHTRR